MALNDGGIATLASALQAQLGWMQLHTASAGSSGTDNVATDRRLVYWTPPADGAWGLASPIRFSGGPSGLPVYSVSLWDLIIDGTFYGEYLLTGGDTVFNANGDFLVTQLDFTITATDS